ncbi:MULTISPECIES: OmpA family protein [Pseudomonas]|uniref:OmpA family protein n=1 Tax=Pseudomonas TaxID=286 RepID=UPI0016104174|nr:MULTISPECIES: OmpA family protein [unclassified Pseudomonas]MBB4819628.1 OOP family OmpA-OmpF porin [Pseudomonas alcaligenes]MCU9948853.1 OmpA family protein [Pseudomonas sp. PDM13]WCD82442.1 OmpA family protein [Pseudomonas sp. TUM22785]
MKLKNTLGVAVGSLVAALSLNALAQGQGAVEVEAFGKRYFTDSSRDLSNGNLLGGSVGYYLTDDVELALSYGEFHDIRSENDTGNKNIKGSQTGLDAIYHFGTPGVGLRPYVSAGFAHQSISNVPARTGRDHSTFANIGTGLKYYFTENFYAKAGLDGMYNIDVGESEWAAGVGVGVNFGGGSKPAAEPAPAPVAEVCSDSDNDGVCDNVDKCPDTPANVTVDADGCPAVAEVVRVELDVKFDFDKSKVKEESYGDIKNLADFMNQYPSTTTTVEGHTDSVGTDAYNQKLSERRANAVREVLVNQYGVGSERVNSVGYGESRPVADNATDAGRAVNRRVEAEVEAQAK